jgi:tRNA A37 N6-isopentenylltransferase MiaA
MTGVGKSKTAHHLAKIINGQVVCADSVQLIKGLDILSNKDYNSLMQGKYTPTDKVDAHKYTKDARKVIMDILK